MGEVLQEAHFSYAQVVYVAGDVGYALREWNICYIHRGRAPT